MMEDTMSRISIPMASRSFGSALALSALMGLATQAAVADEWTLNMTKSKFGPAGNSLVLERHFKPEHAGKITGTVVVVSGGNIYLATPGPNAAVSANGVMSGMNLELIGTGVHATGDCGWACKSTSPNTRLVLSFTSAGAGPHDMGEPVVFNSK
jgi:hypothetical protein